MYKLLVVEDEKAISELLRYGFEREGYTVLTALDGKTALETIENDSPDVILLDLMLPDMDGLSICRTVTVEKNIPIRWRKFRFRDTTARCKQMVMTLPSPIRQEH